MQNKQGYPEKERPVDVLTEKTYSWWGRSLVFITTKKIRTWPGIFLLAFITGVIIAGIWIVSLEIK